ncbi:MAG TPA: hypothetical protein PL037_10145 [Elusimicrobiales bacterium]|nr:hypothetical protein [Elusimicrobiales bacterium]
MKEHMALGGFSLFGGVLSGALALRREGPDGDIALLLELEFAPRPTGTDIGALKAASPGPEN